MTVTGKAQKFVMREQMAAELEHIIHRGHRHD